ncbi:MAG: rhomboid family intramembrane serine protease [Bacteroidota bacterium]
MQAEQNLFESLKNSYRYGGMTIRLLFINAAIFLLIQILSVIIRLMMADNSVLSVFLNAVFTLNTDLKYFIFMPWGLVTSIFAHFSLWHFVLNMLFLYFSGKMFEQLFDAKRLWYTYLFGGIAGGIFEIIAHAIFPALQNSQIVIVGASGSIMAIFMALAFYRPNVNVMLFGLFPVRLIFLALFFLLSDLISLGMNDGVAHFAHLGGAIFGALSIRNLGNKNNIMNFIQRWGDSLSKSIKSIFKGSSKQPKRSNSRMKTDEEYNMEKKSKQEKIDQILDKISKSGYESLTRQEKDFLFNQSKND